MGRGGFHWRLWFSCSVAGNIPGGQNESQTLSTFTKSKFTSKLSLTDISTERPSNALRKMGKAAGQYAEIAVVGAQKMNSRVWWALSHGSPSKKDTVNDGLPLDTSEGLAMQPIPMPHLFGLNKASSPEWKCGILIVEKQ